MSVWPTDAADGAVSSEARWRKMARYWESTGVAQGQAGEMAPTLAALNVTVQAGACWVDGHYCELAGAQVLAVTANGLVVVRFDPAANTAELLYRDAAVALTQNPAGQYEIAVAKMAAAALTDMRPLIDRGGRLSFWTTAGRDLNLAPLAALPAGATVTMLGVSPLTVFRWNGAAWVQPTLIHGATGTATTDGFGNFGIAGMPAGSKWVGASCVGTQTSFPKLMLQNNTDAPPGGSGVLFNCRNPDGSGVANSTIAYSAVVAYTY